MKVKWTPLAKSAVRDTARYIREQFGLKAKADFMQDVHQTSQFLGLNPNIGKVEPLLVDRSVMYRSIVVNRLNKIVYYIDNDHIEIADFWDTRREPQAQAGQVK